jgi:outer membrane protein OmpA-like peptidoglycan-associated protein
MTVRHRTPITSGRRLPPRARLAAALAVSAGWAAWSAPVALEADPADPPEREADFARLAVPELRMSEGGLRDELRKLREQLHEAHVELADKAERIAALEARLGIAASGGEVVRGGRDAMDAAGGGDAPDEPQPSEEDPVESAFDLRYEPRSAANLVAREEALAFVLTRLQQDPDCRFIVVAGADDTPYDTSNKTIAANRARFLVDFFVANGVGRERFEASVDLRGSLTDGTRRFASVRPLPPARP